MTSTSPPATIRVQLFASYAERFGREHLELPLEEVRTVAELLAALRRLPEGGALGPSALVAVNLKQAAPTVRLEAGDEVAVLPPLAGG